MIYPTILRSSLERLLARGIAAGTFRKDIDTDVTADVLLGAMVMAIVTGREYSDSHAQAIADIILNGVLER